MLTNVKDESAHVILRVTLHGKRLHYSTGLVIDPHHWNKKTRRLKNIRGREREYQEVNKILSTYEELTQDIFIANDYGEISHEEFKRELDYRTGREERPEDKTPTLFEFIKDFIEREKTKANAKRGTWKKFISVYNHLQDFAEEQGRELDFKDIDWKFRFEFLEWLYAPPRSHAINNAAKTFEVIKQFMRESQRAKLHSNETYREPGFGVKRVKVKRKVRLTFRELEQLLALDLSSNSRLERVRDLFIVGAYTGLRFSDWHRISPEQITREEDGTELLEIVSRKTRTHSIIPLLPELKAILEKYEFQLPEISLQKFNDYIKEVCQMAIADNKFLRVYSEGGDVKDKMVKKWKYVSSHAARRSFASNFWELGIPAPVLMQITGHATEKQFFEYIDVDKKQIARQFAREAARRLAKKKNDE